MIHRGPHREEEGALEADGATNVLLLATCIDSHGSDAMVRRDRFGPIRSGALIALWGAAGAPRPSDTTLYYVVASRDGVGMLQIELRAV